MKEPTSADVRREQDRVAALVDAAAPERSAPMMTWDGYPALQPGLSTPSTSCLNKSKRSPSPFTSKQTPIPPTWSDFWESRFLQTPSRSAGGDRQGGTGHLRLGCVEGRAQAPGHRVELTLTPNACLAYEALKKQMEADGFRVYVPTFGDDQRITFDKIVGPSLGLYIAVTPDRRDAPTCVTVVSFEMERSDA